MNILSRKKKAQQEETLETIDEGDVVQTAAERVGRVERIAVSPYWPEERDSIRRAYVLPLDPREGWADWCLETEVSLLQKAATAA